MKHRLLVFGCLLALLIVVQAGCGATVTPAEGTQTPPAEVPPAGLIIPAAKPSLLITDEQNVLGGLGLSTVHAVGFTFPGGGVAIKATAVNTPKVGDDGLTVVGVVEIGSGAEKIAPGTYTVAIALAKEDATVGAQVRSIQKDGATYDLGFDRTELEKNPAREDSPSFPPVNPIISSTAVCFVIGLADTSGNVAQGPTDAQAWYRYCSLAATSGDLILSVMDNFPSQYSELRNRIEQSVSRAGQVYAQSVNIDFNLTISEMEGHNNINACDKDQKECSSDITGAPNASFWEDYHNAQKEAQGNIFVVTSAIVKIERPVDNPGQETAEPGDYWVRDWFDPDGKFLGSTLLGVTAENKPVNGLTIPSTPSYFLDKDNPEKLLSWISAWKLCNWCKWQSNCP